MDVRKEFHQEQLYRYPGRQDETERGQIIGWNPKKGKIVSMHFDVEGGRP